MQQFSSMMNLLDFGFQTVNVVSNVVSERSWQMFWAEVVPDKCRVLSNIYLQRDAHLCSVCCGLTSTAAGCD